MLNPPSLLTLLSLKPECYGNRCAPSDWQVAAEHLFFLYMETFAWETLGRKIFRKSLPDNLFTPTKTLAANQGLYNAFLVAGLIWTFFIGDPIWKTNIALFFLGCVAVAGMFGAVTAARRIFYVQGIPALLGIAALLLRGI
jgi:putative membrane protein